MKREGNKSSKSEVKKLNFAAVDRLLEAVLTKNDILVDTNLSYNQKT